MKTIFNLVFIFLITSHAIAQTQKAKSSDGVEIAYSILGKGEPAIVFVHEWASDKNIWKNQVGFLSKKYKVVAIDLAGHGQSGLERKAYKMKLFGDDISAVVNYLQLNKVIIVGHSLGGIAALEAAKSLKGKIVGIIGVDTYQSFDVGETSQKTELFLNAFKNNYDESIKGYLGNLFYSNADTSLVNTTILNAKKIPGDIAIDILRNMLQYNYEQNIKEVKTKVISINGDKFPVDLNKNKKVLPDYECKIIPNTSHYLMVEQPKIFNDVLLETIKEMNE